MAAQIQQTARHRVEGTTYSPQVYGKRETARRVWDCVWDGSSIMREEPNCLRHARHRARIESVVHITKTERKRLERVIEHNKTKSATRFFQCSCGVVVYLVLWKFQCLSSFTPILTINSLYRWMIINWRWLDRLLNRAQTSFWAFS